MSKWLILLLPLVSSQCPITTWYNTTGGGACGIEMPPELKGMNFSVAMNQPQYNIGTCGMCVEMKADGSGAGGNRLNGTYRAFVNNVCPECPWGNLDIGEHGDGRWGITWKAIPCDVGENKIRYVFSGSNEWYFRVSLQLSKYPVKEMSIFYENKWVQGNKHSGWFEFRAVNHRH